MTIKRTILKFLIVFVTSLPLFSMEIDQLTDREKYEESTEDFTNALNDYTNKLLKIAVNRYNSRYSSIRMSQKEIHDLLAFEIYKVTAGNTYDEIGQLIPRRVNLFYALGKSGLGPMQKWIQSMENESYWFRLEKNIYSEIYPDALNKNYIIKVGGEFIGPDKIDHFFDQGYSYWLKSDCGKNDRSAKEFGVESEYGWYGLLAGGVFSFADLRANWAGYQFFKYLFVGEKSHFLVSVNGTVSIRRNFNWHEHIDWQFDELKNPSIYTQANIHKISHYINDNYQSYKKTYQYLKERDFFSWFDKRESFYLIDGLIFDSDNFFDVRNFIGEF